MPTLRPWRAFVADEGIDLIVPSHPVEVRTIACHRGELGKVRLFLPENDAILCADSKWETFRTLRAAGVPCLTPLPSMASTTCALPSPPSPRVRFGCVARARPGSASAWRRCPAARSRTPSPGSITTAAGGGFIASRFLPGRNLTWCGLFRDGDLVAAQTRERLEYVDPACQPERHHRRARGQPHHCLSPSAQHGRGRRARLARNAAWNLFRGHDRGRGRPAPGHRDQRGSLRHHHSLLHRGGCNFPYWAVRLAFGESIAGAPLIDPIAPGVYWLRTLDCGPVLARDLDGPGR